MKYTIEQEDFNKLSQLDRIEYRQVKNIINEKYQSAYFTYSLKISLFVWIGLSLYLALFVAIDKSYLQDAVDTMKECTIIFVLPLIGLILDVFFKNKYTKLIKELNEKYFSASILTKKRK